MVEASPFFPLIIRNPHSIWPIFSHPQASSTIYWPSLSTQNGFNSEGITAHELDTYTGSLQFTSTQSPADRLPFFPGFRSRPSLSQLGGYPARASRLLAIDLLLQISTPEDWWFCYLWRRIDPRILWTDFPKRMKIPQRTAKGETKWNNRIVNMQRRVWGNW